MKTWNKKLSALIAAIILAIPFTTVIVLFSYLSNSQEKFIQFLGLIIGLIYLHLKNEKSLKSQAINDGVFILVYVLISNSILWVFNPSSELNTTIELLLFLLSNNSILVGGVFFGLIFMWKMKKQMKN